MTTLTLQQAFEACQKNETAWLNRKAELAAAEQEYQEQVRKHQRAIQGSKEEVPIPCQMINCFCMFSDYIPLTLDEWIQVDRERREKLKCIEKT
mgnify:CR=1 FL=1